MQLKRLQRSMSAAGYGYAIEGTSIGIAANWAQPSTWPVEILTIRLRGMTLQSLRAAAGSTQQDVGYARTSDLILILEDSVGVLGRYNSGIGAG
jgi:hypothetical protein